MTATKASVTLFGMFLLCSGFGAAAGRSDDNFRETAMSEFVLNRIIHHSYLKAVSPDTKVILLWQATRPTLTYRIPSEDRRTNEGENYLALVDVATGKVLRRIKTDWGPDAWFFPSGRAVVIRKLGPVQGPRIERWDISGHDPDVQGCGAGKEFYNPVVPIDDANLVGMLYRRAESGLSEERLVKLSSSDCSQLESVPVDPDSLLSLVKNDESFCLSSDRQLLGYVLDPPRSGPVAAVVRRTSDFGVLTRLVPLPGWMFDQLVFMPNSQNIIALLYRGMQDDNRLVAVYDVPSGQIRSQFPILADSGKMAVSPDSRWVAVAQVRKKRVWFGEQAQGVVAIYDLQRGNLLTTVAHPWRKATSFAGMFSALAFAGNGEYLITSENDTRIWRLKRDGESPATK